MIIHRRALLASFAATLLCPPMRTQAQSAPAPRVFLADVGGQPGAADAEPAFKAAIARLPRTGGTLVIPPGTWRFARSDGAAIYFGNYDGITIEGAGANLVFRGTTHPFGFADSKHLTLRGLSIDWERPPFSQGEVIAVSPDGKSADIRIDAAFPVDGSETVEAIGAYERGTRLMARGGVDAYNAVEKVTLTAPQTLRLSFANRLPFAPGQIAVLRHKVYEAPLLWFSRCQDILVEDVKLFCGPGMGVIAQYCDTATVRRLTIAPPPGSPRLMSTTADGTHFNSCGGKIIVEDCTMTGMGDDCVNVHGKYLPVSRIIDARSLEISGGAGAGNALSAASASPKSDRLELVRGATYEVSGEAEVTGVEQNGKALTLHFDRDLPRDLHPGDFVLDVASPPQAYVTGCHFPGNRARGVLAHADTVIERCDFSGQFDQAVLLLVEPHFAEGPAISHVDIRNNEISAVCRRRPAGAIAIAASVGAESKLLHDPVRINHDIAVSGNHFADLSGAAVDASSIEGLAITGNRIERGAASAIVLDNVKGVRISGNSCTPAAHVDVPARDAPNVALSDNTGLVVAP